MTHLCDAAESFARTALEGFCDLHGRLVHAVPGGVLRRAARKPGKVALVIGGGSGHYPAFAGYVGPGLADAAVAGDVFASPSARRVRDVAAEASCGGGILLGFGNYAGDVLNFGAAAERLRAEGFDARTLAVTDDIASAPAAEHAKRRGVAGDVAVFKILGAAAEAGLDLDAVEAIGRRANARTRSFGVAFGGCTLPGAAAPLFTVPAGRMAIGLGIHGEPGIAEAAILPAAALAELLVRRLLAEAPADGGRRVAVLLNGLGSTKQEELFVLWASIARLLRAAGLAIVAPLVGEYVTSLDMEGCSLTLTWLDEELERFWCAPCESAVLSIGSASGGAPPPQPAASLNEPGAVSAAAALPAASPASRAAAKHAAAAFARLAAALRDAEAELGRIDAEAGDGDHGQGMARGAAAAAAAAAEAAKAGAGLASLLARSGDAWADRAGGTSGALWGLGLVSASRALNDDTIPTAAEVAQAARLACEAVMRLGGAQPGDKTLVDALHPFAAMLASAVSSGADGRTAWRRASAAAEAGAEATASMLPRLGRARPLAERSLGHRDAGAVSFALCSRVVIETFGESHV
ncbi:dihydroxyacetone kinase family protein [Acidisoma sp. C75]